MKTVLLITLLLTGCASLTARKIVENQHPGSATGAGATLSGPSNSATPSTQTAKRVTVYQPARPAVPPAPNPTAAQPAPEAPPAEITTPAAPAAPVAYVTEETVTTIGQHQDAAGIVSVAKKMDSWSTIKWVGLICLVVGLGGLLWSHGNPDGYPVIFWKVAGIGLFLLMVADNPLWLLLLLLPLGFFAVQKMNLLKLP